MLFVDVKHINYATKLTKIFETHKKTNLLFDKEQRFFGSLPKNH